MTPHRLHVAGALFLSSSLLATTASTAEPPARGVDPGMPLRFESTRTSTTHEEFVARGEGYLVRLSADRAAVLLRSPGPKPLAVTMRLVGASAAASPNSGAPLPGVTNHLVGNDSSRWALGVRGYADVAYRDIYPGVTVVYYGNQRELEYDFIVAPHARPGTIALSFEGAKGVRVDAAGRLVIATEAGDLVHHAPNVYQEIDGRRRPVEGSYAIRANGTVGFDVGQYDTTSPLIIDPVLSYSTYLGGSQQERANAVAVDAQGNIIVVGETYSADFPVAGAVQGYSGNGDAFVAKLSPTGDSLVYATYFGGGTTEFARGVQVDGDGNAYVVGSTWSWDFPTLNAAQSLLQGDSDSFVAKLSPAGTLLFSTLLGGKLEDYGNAIAVDPQGRAHIVGSTISANFPVVNGPQAALGGSPAFRSNDGGNTWSGITAGLETSGVVTFAFDPGQPSTMYAGTWAEGVFRSDDGGTTWTRTGGSLPSPVYALAVVPDSSGTVFAATHFGMYRSHDGGTTWTDLQLPMSVTSMVLSSDGTIYAGTAFYPTPGVLKSSDGGDTWIETGVTGDVQALAVGDSTVYASSNAGVFRITGDGWVPVTDGLPEATFVRAVDPTDPMVAYAGGYGGLFKTTTGGASWFAVENLTGVPVSNVVVAPSDPSTIFISTWWWGNAVSHDGSASWQPLGTIGPTNAPVETIAVHPQLPGEVFVGVRRTWDAFAATLSADGNTLEFSTYVGGSDVEEATGVAVDGNGNTYVAGNTTSTDFPVLNPLQSTIGGLADGFVVKLSSTGQQTYGTYLGGAGSEYHVRIGVDTLEQIHLVGLTWSMYDFPVASAYQPTSGGGYSDAFVSVINAAGDGFVYSTYLGGSGMENDSSQSLGPVVAVAASGDTYVAGTTQSTNFPVTGDAFQPTHKAGPDGFVARFDPNGQLQYSSFLGGDGDDHPRGIAVDASGSVVVTGYTSSSNWPNVVPLDRTLGGPDDAFVARIGEGTPPVVDATPPVVVISSPDARDYLHTDLITIQVSASDDLSGVADGSPSATLDGTSVVIGGTIQLLTLPLGNHVLVGRAADAAGNTAEKATTFRVVATVDSLAAAVNAFAASGQLDAGSRKTLLGKLNDASLALARGNRTGARGKLQEFIDYCADQSGKKIAASAGTLLINDASYVIATI